jgi:hypothetical protein
LRQLLIAPQPLTIDPDRFVAPRFVYPRAC